MKREYLFRGKRTDNGEWVEGDLIHGVSVKKGKMYILPIVSNLAYLKGCDPLDGYEVIPETVSQFTGLTDKNGTKIFDGDIVRFYDDSEDELTNGVVIFNADLCSFCVSMSWYEDVMLMAHWQYEVIGNVHDNT